MRPKRQQQQQPQRPTKLLKSKLDPRYTKKGEVFVVGSGDCAQLGLGPDVFEKERPAKLDLTDIVQVFAGGLHTLALTVDGKLYSWGCNDQKALGRSGEETEPGLVEGLEDQTIIDCACGDSVSVCLTQDGLVYAWGTFRSTNGIFGFFPGVEVQPIPYLLPLKNIVQISSGANHCLALDQEGKIYSWGIGEQGQLGRKVMTRNVLEASLLPRPINFKPYRRTAKFPKVFSGGYHSILVHESNELFSFGLNNYGQLGLGDLLEHQIPDLVEGIDTSTGIKKVAGGEHFTAILRENGEVYVCGRNDSGQLGLPSDKHPEHCSTATKLELPPIGQISCGAAFTLAVTTDGDLYGWGYGEMGQLANGSEDAPEPFQIELKGRKVICATGGGQHSVLLLEPKE